MSGYRKNWGKRPGKCPTPNREDTCECSKEGRAEYHGGSGYCKITIIETCGHEGQSSGSSSLLKQYNLLELHVRTVLTYRNKLQSDERRVRDGI